MILLTILKAILMAKYNCTRAEAINRIEQAESEGSLPELYEIAIMKLKEEQLANT